MMCDNCRNGMSLPELFEKYPMMAETIRHSVRLNGWVLAKIDIDNEWQLRAVEKASMLEAMRQEGICNLSMTALTEKGMLIAGRLLS